MILNFYKYQATGNDFIIVDNRDLKLKKNDTELIKSLCNRKFGIGADGLILLQNHPVLDFEMLYFNSDGNEGTMCGNGGRCIVAFAKKIDLIPVHTKFQAIDGIHEAEIDESRSSDNDIWVKLKMKDVQNIEEGDEYYFLDTGSPNYVSFVEDVNKIDVYSEGRKIRFNKKFGAKGTNVNFVTSPPPDPLPKGGGERDGKLPKGRGAIREGEQTAHSFSPSTDGRAGEGLFVRTYERGVENETLSCGTGVVASAICASLKSSSGTYIYEIKTKGGKLKVKFDKKQGNIFKNIWLEGPTKLVFEGKIDY